MKNTNMLETAYTNLRRLRCSHQTNDQDLIFRSWALFLNELRNNFRNITNCKCNLHEGNCHCHCEVSDLVNIAATRLDRALAGAKPILNVGAYLRELCWKVRLSELRHKTAQKRGGRKNENGKGNVPGFLVPYTEEPPSNASCEDSDYLEIARALRARESHDYSAIRLFRELRKLLYNHTLNFRELKIAMRIYNGESCSRIAEIYGYGPKNKGSISRIKAKIIAAIQQRI